MVLFDYICADTYTQVRLLCSDFLTSQKKKIYMELKVLDLIKEERIKKECVVVKIVKNWPHFSGYEALDWKSASEL